MGRKKQARDSSMGPAISLQEVLRVSFLDMPGTVQIHPEFANLDTAAPGLAEQIEQLQMLKQRLLKMTAAELPPCTQLYETAVRLVASPAAHGLRKATLNFLEAISMRHALATGADRDQMPSQVVGQLISSLIAGLPLRGMGARSAEEQKRFLATLYALLDLPAGKSIVAGAASGTLGWFSGAAAALTDLMQLASSAGPAAQSTISIYDCARVVVHLMPPDSGVQPPQQLGKCVCIF